jgi:hypothetical protein
MAKNKETKTGQHPGIQPKYQVNVNGPSSSDTPLKPIGKGKK